MSATEDFVTQCAAAVLADPEVGAAKEVVERAVRDEHLREELAQADAGVSMLHHSATLTILHVVMEKRPTGAGSPLPHNHLLWAVIGVTHGGEDNEFFRLAEQGLATSGGRVLAEGDVLAMGDNTIHSVKNPSSERLSSALHVYGGDLISTPKTMWCDPDHRAQPFDLAQVLAS